MTKLKPVTRVHAGYPLTEEQCVAVDLALTGQSLKIEAFAGAGKTSTLCAIGEAMPDNRGLYIAFNRAIADEAATKFPSSVECRTAHSLAYRAVGHQFKDRFNRIGGGYLSSRYLKITSRVLNVSPAGIGNLVLDTISRFCQSSDTVIKIAHTPHSLLEKIDDIPTQLAIKDLLVEVGQKTWEMMIDPSHSIPITHDVYLKLWAMSKPTINKDFILFDEAQDASPVMLDLVLGQKAQTIWCGDRYQQIYSWRGAVNAMQTITTEKECAITQSFRFGSPVADLANDILNMNFGAGVNIRGFDKIKSSVNAVENPSVILCRTNATLINAVIGRIERGETVAVVGGCRDTISLLKAADELIEKGKTDHRELALFASWSELRDYSESESGSDMAGLVKLVDKHRIDRLVAILEQCERVKESDADIVLSTVHKAKGREWTSVKLENDFRHKRMEKGYSDEETNILYVAATRAQHQLDVSECDAVNILEVAEKKTGWEHNMAVHVTTEGSTLQ